MHPLLSKYWQKTKHKLPGINCIVYPDGKITILRYTSLYNPNTNTSQLFCSPQCDSTIDSLEQYDAAYWTVVDEWTSVDYQGGKIIGGDGAMGNEGFLACINDKEDFMWGMFFESTNPLKPQEINDDTLIVISEHDDIQLEINLNDLTKIKITVLK